MRVYIVSYTTPHNRTYERAFHDVCNAHEFATRIAHEFTPEMKADEMPLWENDDLYRSHYDTNGYHITFSTIEFYD